MFAEARKLLPERSISALSPRDLLARAMVALLPRSIAPDRTTDGAIAGEEGEETAITELPVVVDPACGGALALMAVADRFGTRVRLAGQDIDEKATRIGRSTCRGMPTGHRTRCMPGTRSPAASSVLTWAGPLPWCASRRSTGRTGRPPS